MDDVALSRSVNKFVPKNRWIASLSNGETIFEDVIEGQPPAWERLALYVRENKLAITMLRAQIGGLEVSLPANQEGYIQKKKIQSTASWTQKSLCIGYSQGGLALIHYLGADKSSFTEHGVKDPGPPFTIYRHDRSCINTCCAEVCNANS